MRLPIKLNRAGWPRGFTRLPFVFDDPRPLANVGASSLSSAAFSNAISTLQFGVTFKTTRPGRQAHSNRLIAQLYAGSKPVILDVGASDGSTSLDLIRSLGPNFGGYFVTDLNLCARCGFGRRGTVYFLDRNGTCVLRASWHFLVYADVRGAWHPLACLSHVLLSGSRKVVDWREVLLVQPELIALARRDSRITIMPYDLFEPWTGRRPDLIKIANLLNSKYFTEAQMAEGLKIQCSNLGINGRLLLVSEDDDMEKFSLFRKTPAGMQLEYTHAGGAKAAPHVRSPVGLRTGEIGQFDLEVRSR
jgi:hypothetical protein